MKQPTDAAPSWFGPTLLEAGIEQSERPEEFGRVWRGFMTARVTLGLVLLLLQIAFYALGSTKESTLLLICTAYFCATLMVRLIARPRPLGKTFDLQWLSSVGVDILAFGALQLAQDGNINYAPLFALPVLMTSILGSMLLAMGASAGVTLLLFFYAGWTALHGAVNAAPLFLQAALTGAGCFALAFLANQFAARLANVELRAQRNQLAARVQRQINELVIESLADGILVMDQRGTVRSANPSARKLLGPERFVHADFFNIRARVGWQGLADLMQRSYSSLAPQQAEVILHHAGQGPRRLQAHTQLTATQEEEADERLCVMFLQDQREMEARMRTEKLASMGRMSAAVAHEIRNPLAAIAQANALLDEDLTDPRQRQLTRMVQQNTHRLEKIVDEVLDLARSKHGENSGTAGALQLDDAVARICRDWQDQTASSHMLSLHLPTSDPAVRFDSEHLRRVLVNLLDNARRYASGQAQSIQVSAGLSSDGQAFLSVWSDGKPMDQSVERHLFEPFFSSESRSSGLGLYICRELCEGNGGSITYRRAWRDGHQKALEGNEFLVCLRGISNRRGVDAPPPHQTTAP